MILIMIRLSIAQISYTSIRIRKLDSKWEKKKKKHIFSSSFLIFLIYKISYLSLSFNTIFLAPPF